MNTAELEYAFSVFTNTPWAKLQRLLDTWLPAPHIIHPYPELRFYAKHQR